MYAQWNRLVLNGETLLRENYDDHGNLFWQYLVPKEERLKVLAQLHCSSHSGHLGLDKTFQRLMTRCYWPGMFRDAKQYARSVNRLTYHCATTRLL